MKKKSLVKRIVSFITALSLSISSTIMIVPASAEDVNSLPNAGETCTLGGDENPCPGTYSWQEDGDNHVLQCNGTTVHTVDGSSHAAGSGTDLGCDICTASDNEEQNDTTFTVTFTSPDANGNTIAVKKGTGDDAVDLSSDGTVTSNDTLTITATAADNYEFKSWTVSGGDVVDSTVAETTVTNITGNVTISAEFGAQQGESSSEPHKVEVVYVASDAGTISAANGTDFESVTAGSKVYFTASPADSDNYSIKTDKDTFIVGKTSSKSVEHDTDDTDYQNVVYYFEMPDEDVTITVEFIPIIKWTDNKNGTYTITSNYGSQKGEKCEGLWIDYSDLLINGRTVADVDSITFTYSFGDNSYFGGQCGICVEPNWNWYVGGSYPAGFNNQDPDTKVENASSSDTITFDLSSKTVMGDGFTLEVWQSDPSSTMTVSDITINFKEYDITADNNIANGSVSVASKAAVGEEVTVTATPTDSESYELDEIIVTYTDGGDTKLVTVTDGKFFMPAADVNVTASFVAKGSEAVKHTVTASTVANGKIAVKDGSSFTDVAKGTTVNFTITPDENYYVRKSSIKVKYGTISVPVEEHTDDEGNVEYYSFVMPNADVTITAEMKAAIAWVKKDGTYTLTSDLGSDDGEWYIDKWFEFSEFIGEDEFIGDIASISFDYVVDTETNENAWVDGGLLIHTEDNGYVQGGYFLLRTENDDPISSGSVVFEFDGSDLDEDGFSIQTYWARSNSSITISNLEVNLKSFPDTKHNVTINYVDEYGEIVAAKESSFENVQTGTKVYFTAKSNKDGYNLRLRDDLVVGETSKNNIDWKSDYTDWQNPVYYFGMPDEDVTINVQFIPTRTWTDNGDGTYTLTTVYGNDANESCDVLEIKLEDYFNNGQTLADIESISFKYTFGENSYFAGTCGIGATPGGEFDWVQGGWFPAGFAADVGEKIENAATTATVTFDLSDVTVIYDNFQLQLWQSDPNSTITISEFKVNFRSFDVNVDKNIENGSVSVSSATAKAGDVVTITATPDNNYKLDEILVTYVKDGVTKLVTVIDNKFTMPGSDVTVTATFIGENATASTHNVTATSYENGKITANGSSSFENVAKDTTVYFKVTANDDNYVKNGSVSVKRGEISLDVKEYRDSDGNVQYYSFIMPNADVTITAEINENIGWTKNADGSYTITSIYGSDEGEQYKGIDVKLSDLIGEGKSISNITSFTFDYSFDTVANSDCYGGGGCWIGATGYDDDGFARSGDYSYDSDNPNPTGTATIAIDGSKIDSDYLYIGFWWAGANTTVTISNIKANFASYNITVADDIENGSIEVSDTTAEAGTEITVTATPDDEYKLDEIIATYDNGGVKTAVPVIDNKFTMPSGDVTVTATFVDENATATPHDITASTGNGTFEAMEGSTFTNVTKGTVVNFTVTPKDGYSLKRGTVKAMSGDIALEVTIHEDEWGTPISYSFTMPNTDVTLSAEYLEKFNWTDNNDGSYSLTTVLGSDAGEEYNPLEINLEDIVEEGKTVADITSISYDYEVELPENEWGHINLDWYGITPEYVDWDEFYVNNDSESMTGTRTFDIDGSTLDDTSIYLSIWSNPGIKLTIDNINASYKSYDITVNDAENGSVTASAETAEAGTEITLTVTPDNEYKLGEIVVTYIDNGVTKAVMVTDNKFTMPSGDVTVTATFVTVDAEAEKHSVSQDENVTGKIEATTDSSFENVVAGTVVKFTVTPEDHYTVKTGTVIAAYSIDEDTQISLEVKTQLNDNNEVEYYYFTMPNADVVISAEYLEKIDWVDNNDGSYSITSNLGSDSGEGYEYLEVTLDYILDDNTPISELVSFSFDYSFDTDANPDCMGGGGCWMFATTDDGDFAFGGNYSFNNDGNSKPNGTATFKVDGSSITGETLYIGFWWSSANTTVTISNIKANYRQHTFIVDIDGTKSAVDTWTEVYNLFNAKSVSNADIVITINDDYTFTNKDKLPTAQKAKSLTINGNGTLIFDKTVTALKFVSETTLDVKTALSAASTKKLAVSSTAANKKLTLGENFSGDIIGKLSGAKTIELVINSDVSVDQLATFKNVTTEEGVLTVNGNVSAITEFDGSIRLAGGAKSTAAIDKLASESVIDLIQDANKAIPKLTLKETEEITINVVDNEATIVDLVPGTAIAYVSGKNGEKIAENITVGNTYPEVTELTANYYTKGNVIKAENNSAITLIYDGGEENCPTLEYAVDWVNKQKLSKGETLGDVKITVNNDVTAAANFALPSKNVKTLTFDGEGSITFLGTKLAIPYSTTFDVTIMVNNKTKTLDLTVSGKNVELVINQSVLNHIVIEADEENGIEAQSYYESYFGKVTGKNDSILTVEPVEVDDQGNAYGDQIRFTNITTFNKVTGDIKVSAGISKVTEFGGLLVVEGEKTNAEITKIISAVDGDSTSILLRETSLNALPKLTITSIDSNTTLYFDGFTNDWRDLDLETGRTILYTKDNKFAEDGYTLENIVIQSNSDTNGEPTMRAVYNKKTKSVVAKSNNVNLVLLETYTDDVTDCTEVDNGNEGFYETFEEAIAYIDKNGNDKTNFKITVKESIEVAKFALPKAKKAKELTIVCDGDSIINVGKTASATANSDIVLDSAMFKTTAKALTLTAKGNVTINGNTGFDVFKGTKNFTMTVIGCSIAKFYDVSNFGNVVVKKDDSGSIGKLMINTTLNVEKLTLKEDAELVINDTLKTGTFKKFEAEDGAAFTFWSVGKNTLKYAGKAADFITPEKGVKVNAWYGVKVLSTKILDSLNDKFTYGGDDPISSTANVEPCFAQVGNDIVLLSELFELKQGEQTIETYAQWTDAVNYINTYAKNNKDKAKTTEYTITILDVARGTTAIKFPNANTYKKLTVRSDDTDRKWFSFTGSLSLTGDTVFENLHIAALDKKENITKFNLSSNFNLDLENVYARNVTIKAKNLTIRDFSIWGEKITVSETLTTKDACIDTTGLTTKNWVLEAYTGLGVVNGSKITVKDTIKRAESVKDSEDVGIWLSIIEKNKDSDGNSIEVTEFKKSYKVASVKNGADLINYERAEYAFVNDGKGNLTIQKRPWTFTGKTIVFSSLYGKAIEYAESNDGHYMISSFLEDGKTNTDVKSLTFSVNFKKGKASGCIATSSNDTSKDDWGEWLLSGWNEESKTVKLDFGDYGIYAEREDLLFQIWSCDAKTEIEFKLIDIQYK